MKNLFLARMRYEENEIKIPFAKPGFQPFLKSASDKDIFDLMIKKTGITHLELEEIRNRSIERSNFLRENFAKRSNMPITCNGLPFNQYYLNNKNRNNGVAYQPRDDGSVLFPSGKPDFQDAEVHVLGAGSGYLPKPIGDDDDMNKFTIDYDVNFFVPETGDYAIDLELATFGLYSVIADDTGGTTKAAAAWIDVEAEISNSNGLVYVNDSYESFWGSYQFFTTVGDMYGALDFNNNVWFALSSQNINEQFGILLIRNLFDADKYNFVSDEYSLRLSVSFSVYARGEGASADLVFTKKVGGGVYCEGIKLTPQ